jgi:Arc/MetJ family transcription regulator
MLLPNVYIIITTYICTNDVGLPMRTNIEIDDALMAEAQKASGYASKKQTVEQALRLLVRLRRQHEVGAAFGSTAGVRISLGAANGEGPVVDICRGASK